MNMCDINGAFDSPSYTGIQLSLWRLELPDLVTQMIITMEAGGKTSVRTPLTQSILDKEGKAGLHNLTHEVPNAISSHSFKPLPSLHHHGPSTRASFGTSRQHCRHTHNRTIEIPESLSITRDER